MTWQHYSNRPVPGNWATLRTQVFDRDGDVCHVCGHDGATDVDHVVNVARWSKENRDGDPHAAANLAPIHGERCATCGRRCHKDKTQREARDGHASRRRPRERHPGLTG